MAAFLAHAVGFAIVFAAPRGLRMRGLVLNGLVVAFLGAFLILGFAVKHHIGVR
jgi:hypothetical protein